MISISLFLIGLATAQAAEPLPAVKLTQLLNQATRPTHQEIEAALGANPTNPFSELVGKDYRARNIARDDRLAAAIAAFEWVFPGARFYSLGRDAVYVGDAMDAFYRLIGQPDRVHRLDASNTSFHKNDRETYGFLKTNGIDLFQPNHPPYVIFDVTSFSQAHGVGGMSQSVQLIRAGYSGYAAQGGNPKDLIRKLNFISIGMSPKDTEEMADPGFDREKYFARQTDTATETGFTFPFFTSLLEQYSYTDAWHGMFKDFKRLSDGRVVAQPGEIASELDRKSVLAEMIHLQNTVATPEFLAKVQLWANYFGYEFPLEYSTTLHDCPPEKKQAALKEVEAQQAVQRELDRKEREEYSQRWKSYSWAAEDDYGDGYEPRPIATSDKYKENKRAKRNQANRLSPLGEHYMDLFEDRLDAGEDRTQAIQFILEDLRSGTSVTEQDLACIVKTALATFDWKLIHEELIASIAEAATQSAVLRKVIQTYPFKDLDIYGYYSPGIKKNAARLKKVLKRRLKEIAKCGGLLG